MKTRFKYEARGPSGRIERGAIDAESVREALERLRRRNLTPFVVSPTASTNTARLDTIAARDLSVTLAQLLRAGLSFGQALRFASEELTRAPAGAALRMREAAERGEPASAALGDFTGPEARLLRGVIRAGETSGRLVEALDMAAQSFAHAANLRARIGAALIYPSFVIVATLATLACFLLLVVPTLGQAFAGAEDRLPSSTRALLALSAWLQENGMIFLLAVIGAIAIVSVSPPVRAPLLRIFDRLLVSSLGLGVAQRLDFAAFSSLAALSLQAGVPASTAFEAAASAVRSAEIRGRLFKAVSDIRVGERPSQAFERWTSPPKSFLRLTHVGEETGKLGETLRQAGALLSAEAEQRLERLGAIAGPVVTLLLGLLVGAIVLSLFLGLLAMSELATV